MPDQQLTGLLAVAACFAGLLTVAAVYSGQQLGCSGGDGPKSDKMGLQQGRNATVSTRLVFDICEISASVGVCTRPVSLVIGSGVLSCAVSAILPL